jgi:hypothetical protein
LVGVFGGVFGERGCLGRGGVWGEESIWGEGGFGEGVVWREGVWGEGVFGRGLSTTSYLFMWIQSLFFKTETLRNKNIN